MSMKSIAPEFQFLVDQGLTPVDIGDPAYHYERIRFDAGSFFIETIQERGRVSVSVGRDKDRMLLHFVLQYLASGKLTMGPIAGLHDLAAGLQQRWSQIADFFSDPRQLAEFHALGQEYQKAWIAGAMAGKPNPHEG